MSRRSSTDERCARRMLADVPRGRTPIRRHPGAVVRLALVAAAVSGAEPSAIKPLDLTPDDRILVLAPHPDDEAIGCGGVIQKALAMNLPVQVVWLTYGDHNQWSFLVYRKHAVILPQAVRAMGMVRHDEALRASIVLGLSSNQVSFLGYPDHGTLRIWNDHWGDRPAFDSLLTRTDKVPYPNAYRPGAPYKGEEIVRDLTAIIREFRPTRVFVSHPADFNPDHRALYLFARIALWDLAAEIRPSVHPYLVHFQKWPARRGARPGEPLDPPAILAHQIGWEAFSLSPEEVTHKQSATRAHKTQFKYASRYLLSFARTRELFGDFPVISLAPARAARVVPPGSAAQPDSEKSPDPLTDEEREAFVGLELRTVQLDGDSLLLAIELSRPLAKAVSASIYVFGYRPDVPFAKMPKIHIALGALDHDVLDQARKLSDATVVVTRRAREITVRVPLKALNRPDRVLMSARTYLSELPLDWAAWRVVELPGRQP